MALYLYGTKIVNSLVVDGSIGSGVIGGKNTPSSVMGSNGQIYLKHLPDLSSINIRESISNSAVGAYFDTGYYYNANTRIEMKVNLSGGATYPSFFGTRADTSGRGTQQMFIATYGTRAYYAFGCVEVYTNDFFSLDTDVLFKTQGRLLNRVQGGITKEMVTNAYENTPVASIYLFAANLNGAPWTDSYCIMTFYYCKIFEGDTLVHYYLPALDGSDVPCLYDCITGDYIYNSGTGTLTVGSAATIEKSITNAYAKVDGAWQDLIGTGLDDIDNAQQAREALYTLPQSQGGAWINTDISVAGISEFLFVSTADDVENYSRTIQTSDIPVYSGSDVYLTVFSNNLIDKAFNVRIYNSCLSISFESAGSSSKAVSIYSGGLEL